MRHLILLRHAKAEPSSPDGDFGRALAPRGVRQARRFAQWLAEQTFTPDLVIASAARRTRETATLATASLTLPPLRIDERDLYNADGSEILAVARHAPPATTSLMLVGHNPGMAELASRLTGGGDALARKAMLRQFPTCACAVLAFDIGDWSALGPAGGRLLAFITPRGLDSSEIDD